MKKIKPKQMKKLEINQEDLIEVVDKIAKNHQSKFFDIYSNKDIYQVVWQIALEKLPEFNQTKSTNKTDFKKSLEHWLNRVINNRLKNLYRDKYVVQFKGSKKQGGSDFINGCHDSFEDFDGIDGSERLENILSVIDLENYYILESILNGESINYYYKNRLIKCIEDAVKNE